MTAPAVGKHPAVAAPAKMISPTLMRAFADSHPAARFVEIGANDGVFLDPLHPYVSSLPWSGVMVEPVPHLFERLRANYADNPRVALERAAISGRAGRRTIHYLAEDAPESGMPIWRDAIASFDREHVLAGLGREVDAERWLREVEVECLTFDALCDRHGIERPDLVLVDAEGADWEIVESIDLDRRRPRLLVFEHHHLGEAELAACRRLLEGSGFALVADGLDTWALDLAPDDELSDRWRRAAAASSE